MKTKTYPRQIPFTRFLILIFLTILLSGLAACERATLGNNPTTSATVPAVAAIQTATQSPYISTAKQSPTEANSVSGNVAEFPFYARHAFADGVYLHDNEWAAIYFYRPPDCVPPAFNLLEFSNPGEALNCGPLTTVGIVEWSDNPSQDDLPLESHLTGSGTVPVWFVRWPVLEAAVADGSLKMFELKILPSLQKGTAGQFRETVMQNPCCSMEMFASGQLENGEAFEVTFNTTQAPGNTAVTETRIRLPEGLAPYLDPQDLLNTWSNESVVLEISEDIITVYLYWSVIDSGRAARPVDKGAYEYNHGILVLAGIEEELSSNPCAGKAAQYFVARPLENNDHVQLIEIDEECQARRTDFRKPFTHFKFPE